MYNKRYKGAMSYNSETTSPSGREVLDRRQGSEDLLLKDTKMCVGRFFYENGLDFSAVNSPFFQRMISLFSRGMRYQTPTIEELKGWIFEELVKEMQAYVNDIRKSWAETGCSILLDGWTDANGQELVNVLVDCPKGTVYLCSSDITECVNDMDWMQLFFAKVLAEVGVENVVQIITYSGSDFMKEAGKQLMETYRPIFWTVSASYCIELMLEKVKGTQSAEDTLEKAKFITRYIHSHPVAQRYVQDHTDGSGLVDSSKIRSIRPFLTLERIVMEKETLKEMFLSSRIRSILTSDSGGQRVAELVADRSFWSGALTVVKGAIPLVRVIEWMNTSSRDHMGYIYETIDQAKETIKEEFKNKESQFLPFWEVIDDVWNEFLYNPLHSAGYLLNPNLYYSSEVSLDPEVFIGVYRVLVRSAVDIRIHDKITVQLEHYRTAKGAMAAGVAEDQRLNVSPALWWSRYGGECPELQRLAVRILSQTCDGALKFQLKRSLAEALHRKGRSETQQKWHSDMVFLRYNMQLMKFIPGKSNYAMCDELDLLDDWIVYI